MKKDLMSYCGEDILESADEYVEKAKTKRIRTTFTPSTTSRTIYPRASLSVCSGLPAAAKAPC